MLSVPTTRWSSGGSSLGQSTPTTAVVAGGLKEGEMVVSEGVQRVRPGIEVSPGPATPPPTDPSVRKS